MTNIELAQAIEDSLAFLRTAPNENIDSWGRSSYTCDALNNTLPCTGYMLRSIGPEVILTPYNSFGDIPAKSRQLARALWLTLLAELAERGDLTLDGLK